MKPFPTWFILSVLLSFLWGCDRWGGGLPEQVIAQVNGEQIPVGEFDREYKELVLEPGRKVKEREVEELRRAVLDQVIERKLLVQEARRLGMKISPEELDQAIFEIRKDYPGEGFGEKLGLKGITLEEWRVRFEEKLLAEKMMRSAMHLSEGIDDQEARQYYEEHRSSFQVARRVRARQIVLADGEDAIQVLKRLRKGENFEKVAMEKSLGPEKVFGGDLGYFGQGEKPAEFDHVFEMEVGTISEVVKSPYGYHLFKLEEKIEARQIPFEEARAGILQELGQKKGEDNYQRWFNGLRGKAKVKINQRWLSS
jgi:parvulin-like peptidyl-prolyl isomerase